MPTVSFHTFSTYILGCYLQDPMLGQPALMREGTEQASVG